MALKGKAKAEYQQRYMEKRRGSNKVGLTIQVPLSGTRSQMESIICHYDPSKVTQALSGFRQVNTWGKAP